MLCVYYIYFKINKNIINYLNKNYLEIYNILISPIINFIDFVIYNGD